MTETQPSAIAQAAAREIHKPKCPFQSETGCQQSGWCQKAITDDAEAIDKHIAPLTQQIEKFEKCFAINNASEDEMTRAHDWLGLFARANSGKPLMFPHMWEAALVLYSRELLRSQAAEIAELRAQLDDLKERNDYNSEGCLTNLAHLQRERRLKEKAEAEMAELKSSVREFLRGIQGFFSASSGAAAKQLVQKISKALD